MFGDAVAALNDDDESRGESNDVVSTERRGVDGVVVEGLLIRIPEGDGEI